MKRREALRAGEETLRRALTDALGEITLGQVYEQRGVALAITAVEMSQHRSWVFKTPHFPGTNHRDDDYSLVDVCMATSAAPIFRSLAALDHPQPASRGFNLFADGGLWANNPVLVALIEALDMASPDQNIHVFSLGTCPIPAGEHLQREARHRGLAEWRFGGDAASLAIDAQEFAYDHMARKLLQHLTRACEIVRFPNDKVPAELVPYLALDDTRPEAVQALINQARTDADMTNSLCGNARDPKGRLICSLFESAPVSNPRHPSASSQQPAP
jgi:hypothetical protein